MSNQTFGLKPLWGFGNCATSRARPESPDDSVNPTYSTDEMPPHRRQSDRSFGVDKLYVILDQHISRDMIVSKVPLFLHSTKTTIVMKKWEDCLTDVLKQCENGFVLKTVICLITNYVHNNAWLVPCAYVCLSVCVCVCVCECTYVCMYVCYIHLLLHLYPSMCIRMK